MVVSFVPVEYFAPVLPNPYGFLYQSLVFVLLSVLYFCILPSDNVVKLCHVIRDFTDENLMFKRVKKMIGGLFKKVVH